MDTEYIEPVKISDKLKECKSIFDIGIEAVVISKEDILEYYFIEGEKG